MHPNNRTLNLGQDPTLDRTKNEQTAVALFLKFGSGQGLVAGWNQELLHHSSLRTYPINNFNVSLFTLVNVMEHRAKLVFAKVQTV